MYNICADTAYVSAAWLDYFVWFNDEIQADKVDIKNICLDHQGYASDAPAFRCYVRTGNFI